MSQDSHSINFGQHMLAVLAGAVIASTTFAVVWTAGLAWAMPGRPADLLWFLRWLAILTGACWLGVLLIALPASSIVLSLLWPITRRRTRAGRVICVIAAATMGIVLAPMANPKMAGASPLQTLVFAGTGVLIALVYVWVIGGSWHAKRRAHVAEPFV